MGASIAVDVLGPLRITVQGHVVEPPAQVATLLVALAVADQPIRKVELAREVLYLSPSSIDSRLSRLHGALGSGVPIHRVPASRSGLVELDRHAVAVDADQFRALVAAAESLVADGHRDEALERLCRAEALWRHGAPAWHGLGDPHARTPFGRARDQLCQRLSGIRELAAQLSVGQRRDGPQHVRELRPPVGREREFADLWRHAEEVAARRGGLHLLSGEAGSGKSHLLAHLERSASSDLGIRVIHVDVEERVGFHRALRHGLAALWRELEHRADRPAELVDRAGEIAAFVATPTGAEPQGVQGREPVAPVAHAELVVGTLLRAVAAPTLLVFDNVHRAAPELPALLVRLSGDALGTVGVIASFRPEGPTVGALGAAHPLTVLEPLDRSAAGRFLSATRGRRLGDPEVDRVYRQSGGMPLALLHAGDGSDGPAAEPSVTATLSTWLAARPMDAQRALGVAAVLADGTRFDLAVAASLLADEPGTLAALGIELDAAVAVRRVEGMGAFTHRAWRDVVYANVEAHRRRGLHRRVLELLERRVSGSSDPVELAAVAAAIAHHAELADSRGLATTIGVGALVRAADNLGPYETTTALSLYATALEIARPEERLAILLRQGRLRRLSAQWNEAEEDLRAAVEAAEVLGDLVAETEATLLMAHMTWDPQRWGGTLEDRLASLVERMPPDEISLRARLQACLAGGTYQDGATGAGPESGVLARAAADVVDRLEPGDAAEVLMWARKGLLDLEPPERTLAMAASMRRLAGGSTYLTANALLASVVDNIRLGADDAARADSDAYRALAATHCVAGPALRGGDARCAVGVVRRALRRRRGGDRHGRRARHRVRWRDGPASRDGAAGDPRARAELTCARSGRSRTASTRGGRRTAGSRSGTWRSHGCGPPAASWPRRGSGCAPSPSSSATCVTCRVDRTAS